MANGHQIAMTLRAAYWGMHRAAEAALSRHGVTANQFVVLALLADHGPITQQALVRLADSDANTVRAMLLLLERGGLIARRPHETDGRALLVSLTPKGQRRYATLWAASHDFHERLLAAVGVADADAFLRMLAAVRAVDASNDNLKLNRARRATRARRASLIGPRPTSRRSTP